jgi:tetratricopeptide (TPR) repeat protein
VAAVFALHPLQVESVAWAAERKGLLCGFFWMATLLAYSAYTARPGPNLRYAAVVVCAGAALLSKPVAVTLPFVLLLLDYWPLQRLGASREQPLPHGPELRAALYEKGPLLVLAAASSVITLRVQQAAGATGFGESLSLLTRAANAAMAYGAYLRDAVWPTQLAVFYPHPYVEGVDSWVAPIALALLGAGLTAVAVRVAPTRGYLAVSWLWFLGTLVPVIGLVTVGFAARADRYMYVPLIGLALAAAWGAVDLVGPDRRRRAALSALAMACIGAMGFGSWLQLQHWRDTIRLFEHAARVTEGNFIAHHRLATAKLFGGRSDEAEAHFLASIASGPPRAAVHAGLADLLADQGRLDDAGQHYQRALAIAPGDPRVDMKLGFVLVLSGRHADARPHLERARARLGDSAELHMGLGMAAAGDLDLAAAIGHYRAALAISPGLPTAADKLAWILATSEDVRLLDPSEAVRLAEGVNTPRRSARTLDTLAAAYAAAGRFEDALQAAREAERLAANGDMPHLQQPIRERAAFYENGRPFIDWNSRAIH